MVLLSLKSHIFTESSWGFGGKDVVTDRLHLVHEGTPGRARDAHGHGLAWFAGLPDRFVDAKGTRCRPAEGLDPQGVAQTALSTLLLGNDGMPFDHKLATENGWQAGEQDSQRRPGSGKNKKTAGNSDDPWAGRVRGFS